MEETTVEVVNTVVQLDVTQFEAITEHLTQITEMQWYITFLLLVILIFVALSCGITLAQIFARYFRG